MVTDIHLISLTASFLLYASSISEIQHAAALPCKSRLPSSGLCKTCRKWVETAELQTNWLGNRFLPMQLAKKKKDLNSYRRFCLLHTYHDTTLCSLMFCLALFCLKLLIPDKTICVTFICNSQKWLQLCKTQKVTYHPTICICSYGTEEHSIGPFLSK